MVRKASKQKISQRTIGTKILCHHHLVLSPGYVHLPIRRRQREYRCFIHMSGYQRNHPQQATENMHAQLSKHHDIPRLTQHDDWNGNQVKQVEDFRGKQLVILHAWNFHYPLYVIVFGTEKILKIPDE